MKRTELAIYGGHKTLDKQFPRPVEQYYSMKKIIDLLWFLLPFIFACSRQDVSQYVDPNIGGVAPLLTTKNPTVHRPNSMVRVFPVTKPGLNDRYLCDRIYGFALNMPAYRMGHVTELMPLAGKLTTDRDEYASLYDHDLEEVHPWYHRVLLEDSNIEAEWTTTERTVLYRFTFNNPDIGYIIFRPGGKARFTIKGNAILGWEEFGKARQYFYAEFSQRFDTSGSFGSGDEKGIYIRFDKPAKPVEVRTGLSFIDEDQAARNLKKEAGSKSFEAIRDESHKIWTEALGRIRLSGGTERQSWDTYRSLHPLMLILDPAKQADMIESYVRMYEQNGWVPGFPQVNGDFPAMIGFHSAALVWDAWQKGIRNFNAEKAYEGLRKNALQATMLPWRTGPMCSLDSFYHTHGWYPALPGDSAETVSLVHAFERRQAVAVTLEHSYDDWCLALLAKDLGKEADYRYFLKRSNNYRNVFNPATGFMAPKMADGRWVEPFDPQLSGGIGSRMYFAENNAWTWNFSVQHDIPGLIELLGGKEAFLKRLDALFNEPTRISKWQFMGQFPDATGLNGMFVAGNEPSFHIPYLYNYAGQPWRTQRRIREIMDMWFDDRPPGIPGDEDGGGLCSWYVFSAMGFFPVTPGSGEYAIGSPFFESIRIQLSDGKTFSVVARNCSRKNKYIQSARLNGQPLNKPFISHTDIVQGGKLVLVMGERPNKEWGSSPE
jgi:putative alpha-1,2-mannosidase